ncbi:MAG: DUF3467 domain-containing protein [Methanothrix sp.]|uniref:DUF3467 domain-containing protein n=1 Tax=Methanothrix sp. TaxID=90426 RepID=UPI0031686A0E
MTDNETVQQEHVESEGPAPAGPARESKTIDFRHLYQMDPENTSINITASWYSNLAYIQVTQRDVMIDFLQMPGAKKNEGNVIEATRIYMTHAAAQKMIRSLEALLERVYKDGEMEIFSPASPKTEPTTEVRRAAEMDKA